MAIGKVYYKWRSQAGIADNFAAPKPKSLFMFKLFQGFHLVEAYHEWKKNHRQDKIMSRMIKLAIAVLVLITLWALPADVFGIAGLTIVLDSVLLVVME